jgi:TolC family type I secretion outer membrane protein
MFKGNLVSASLIALVVGVIASPSLTLAQSLDEALAQAYAGNPRLLSERAALRAIDEGVPTALSGWRPTVAINGSVGKSYTANEAGSTGRVTSQSTLPASAGINLSQPLYRGGATTAETEAAESRVLAGRSTLIDVEQQVLVAAGTAYMNVVRDQSVIELNINNEKVLERQLQATLDRFEVGEVTRTDVSQAEARLADASASRIEAEGNLDISRANYERFVGSAPGLLTFPEVSDVVQLPANLEAAEAAALQRNPTVLRAGFTERAALHDISAAGAQLLPTITLDGNAQRSIDPNSFFAQSDSASLTANVRVPLYQSGSEYARIRELRQVAVQRRRELDEARREAREGVSETWERLQTSRARIRALESSVRANEIALDGVEQEAAVGARTVLDVLDAEQELFEARVTLVRERAAEVVFAFEVLQVVGNMVARDLGLATDVYDPTQYYDQVRDKWIGFGEDYNGTNPLDFESDLRDLGSE